MLSVKPVSLLKSEVNSELDPWQFAYKQGRSTDDAFSSITQLVLWRMLAGAVSWLKYLIAINRMISIVNSQLID